MLVAAASIAMAATTILSIKGSSNNFFTSLRMVGRSIAKIMSIAAKNGIPHYVVYALLFTFVVGAILLTVSLLLLAKPNNIDSKKRNKK